MTRGVPATYQTAMQAVTLGAVHLFEISTGQTGLIPATLYVAKTNADFVFPTSGGETYTARPCNWGDYKIAPGEYGGLDVTFADSDDYFQDLLDAGVDFRWKKFKHLYVNTAALDSYDNAITNVWRISRVSRATHAVVFSIDTLQATLQRHKLPGDVMTKKRYPGIPKEGLVR